MFLFPFVGVCISLGVAVQLVSLRLGWLPPSLGGMAMTATRNIECEAWYSKCGEINPTNVGLTSVQSG